MEWSAVNRIGFRSEDPQDPTANTVPAVGDYDVSNLALYLAVEKNQQIANSLMAKTQSGFSMLVRRQRAFGARRRWRAVAACARVAA